MGGKQNKQQHERRRSSKSTKQLDAASSSNFSFGSNSAGESGGGDEWPSLAESVYKSEIRNSWSILQKRGLTEVSDELYGRLFAKDAKARQLFSHSDMMLQKRLFPTVLESLLDRPEVVRHLGAYHAHMDVTSCQVDTFIICLHEAVCEVLGPDFCTQTVSKAWKSTLATMADIFKETLSETSQSLKASQSASQAKGKKNESTFQDNPPLHDSFKNVIPIDHSGWLIQVKPSPSSGLSKKKVSVEQPPPQFPNIATRRWGKARSHISCHAVNHGRLEPSEPQQPASQKAPVQYYQQRLVRTRNHDLNHKSQRPSLEPPEVELQHTVIDDPQRKKRWLELKGQYLFYSRGPGEKHIGIVDLSECEVVDELDVNFSFSLQSLAFLAKPLQFHADGDNQKELWVIRLKRAANRFSFVRPFLIGQQLRVSLTPETSYTGICLWLGTVEGTPLTWKGSGMWVGVELSHPVDGGHGGTVSGHSFFTCKLGHGVLVPAVKASALSDSLKLENRGDPFRPDAENANCNPEHFDFLAILGKGSFGCVCKVREKTSGRIFACKILQKAALVKEKQVGNLHREKSILMNVTHPYIVNLHAAFQTRGRLLLLFDFLSGGELWFHMTRQGKTSYFSENRARLYFAQVTLAINHLHSKNILHRDLKLENLVLDSEGHVVLTDFGFAKTVDAAMTSIAQCGTVPYMAPEILAKRGYGYEVDWWSLGIVLFLMLTGCYPYWVSKSDGSIDTKATISQILYGRIIQPGEFPDHPKLSEDATDLCCLLLMKDPTKRLSNVIRIKTHCWFSSFDWIACEKRKIVPDFIPNNKGKNTKYFTTYNETPALSDPPHSDGEDGEDHNFATFSSVRRPQSTVSEDYDLDNLSYLTPQVSSQYVFETDT